MNDDPTIPWSPPPVPTVPLEPTDGMDATEYVRNLIARTKLEVATGKAPSRPAPIACGKPVQPIQPPACDVSLSNVIIDDVPSILERPTSAASDPIYDGLPPTRTKPEEMVDFNQLREAARLTATSALDAFDCKGMIARAYTYVAIAVFALLMSLVLLTMSRYVDSPAFASSVATLILAAVATYRHAAITRTLSRKANRQS